MQTALLEIKQPAKIIPKRKNRKNEVTYSESKILASENPNARDRTVVVRAKQDDASKSILAQFIKTLEHS